MIFTITKEDYENSSKDKLYICPDCSGDGIATCHNPDHGFLSSFMGANESACPCCGHDHNYKMKGKCYTCDGNKIVSYEEGEQYIYDNDLDIALDPFLPAQEKPSQLNTHQ